VNIQISTSALNTKPIQIALTPANMNVNINFIRERTNSPSNVSSRGTSVLLKAFSISYYERMEIKNNLPNEDIVNPIDSSQLLYKSNNNTDNSIGKATDIGPIGPNNMFRMRL